jgi:hypothetical protein
VKEAALVLSAVNQVAEKLLFGRVRRYWHLQGLKPNVDLIGFIGPTEVVPFYKTLKIPAGAGFSAACKADFDLMALCGGCNPRLPATLTSLRD